MTINKNQKVPVTFEQFDADGNPVPVTAPITWLNLAHPTLPGPVTTVVPDPVDPAKAMVVATGALGGSTVRAFNGAQSVDVLVEVVADPAEALPPVTFQVSFGTPEPK
jgi:hypothetical protein